jgi:lipoate-protein ligase A
VGGGAVFLDGQQIFYQLVIHRDHPQAPKDKREFYKVFLAPVVKTYQELGVDVHYKPVNDILTAAGRKISGNGAGDIGDYAILVGNLIADFDYETMVRVLRVPDAKFRDKVFKSLYENLTTLKRELGQIPTWESMTHTLMRNFESVLGSLSPAPLPATVYDQVAKLARTHTSEEWLLKPGKRLRDGRKVGIATGVDVIQRMHKAPGGLIRATLEVQEGRILAIGLSGDFFFYPADKLADLEQILLGVELAEAQATIERFYRDHDIQSPGVTPQDLAVALGAR